MFCFTHIESRLLWCPRVGAARCCNGFNGLLLRQRRLSGRGSAAAVAHSPHAHLHSPALWVCQPSNESVAGDTRYTRIRAAAAAAWELHLSGEKLRTRAEPWRTAKPKMRSSSYGPWVPRWPVSVSVSVCVCERVMRCWCSGADAAGVTGIRPDLCARTVERGCEETERALWALMKANAVRVSAAVWWSQCWAPLQTLCVYCDVMLHKCCRLFKWTGWLIDSVQYALIEALLISVGMCCINTHWITDDTANTGHQKNYRTNTADWMRFVLIIDDRCWADAFHRVVCNQIHQIQSLGICHCCDDGVGLMRITAPCCLWSIIITQWGRIACGFFAFMSVVSADVCSIGVFVWTLVRLEPHASVLVTIDPLIVVPAAQKHPNRPDE